jgi:hypothetical protein
MLLASGKRCVLIANVKRIGRNVRIRRMSGKAKMLFAGRDFSIGP